MKKQLTLERFSLHLTRKRGTGTDALPEQEVVKRWPALDLTASATQSCSSRG